MNVKSHYLIIFFFGCGLFLKTNGYSQSEKSRKQTFPVAVSITNHSWAFPFKEIFRMSPFYPGLSIETELYYKRGEHVDFFQTGQLGGFINQSAGSGLYFNTNLGLRYAFNFGLTTDVSLGLGYFQSYYPSVTYKQNEVGEYEKTNRSGVGALSSNISLRVGYDFSKKYTKNMTAFVRYQWIASTSYWSLITIRPNGLLHVGITFNPFFKN